jgi:molybdopterin molybdotransferase
MISFAEARALIQNNICVLPRIDQPIENAFGFVLAENVYSPNDFPHEDQSAMDGYAFCYADWFDALPLQVKRNKPAGDTNSTMQLEKGEAIRIFTGSVLPIHTDTVVMQEFAECTDGLLVITNKQIQRGDHIRKKGTQTKRGDLVIEKGTLITPAIIGLLISVGVQTVPVFLQPTCTIITTGNELVEPGVPLQSGQVYESNSYTLLAALKQMNIPTTKYLNQLDQLSAISEAIQRSLEKSDLLLLTGGVSVGDYDFVTEALALNGVRQIFHKVKQKPGKPIYFGMKGEKMIFGLPGNPGSVLTCFYMYVLPAIYCSMGANLHAWQTYKIPLLQTIKKKEGLTHFIKAVWLQEGVLPLEHQESYKMNSFAQANVIIQLDEERTIYDKGELVDVFLLQT